jgi:hypothetical protein
MSHNLSKFSQRIETTQRIKKMSSVGLFLSVGGFDLLKKRPSQTNRKRKVLSICLVQNIPLPRIAGEEN